MPHMPHMAPAIRRSRNGFWGPGPLSADWLRFYPNRPQALKEDGYPELRCLLIMGGVDSKQQYDMIKQVGA